jgi:hypothetical protein
MKSPWRLTVLGVLFFLFFTVLDHQLGAPFGARDWLDSVWSTFKIFAITIPGTLAVIFLVVWALEPKAK